MGWSLCTEGGDEEGLGPFEGLHPLSNGSSVILCLYFLFSIMSFFFFADSYYFI